MNDLSSFPVTRKWPPRHPDRLQLYSLPTPNGVKVSIALEEIGLPYELHLRRPLRIEQKSAEFTSLNPYQKIPAIIDPNGPGGRPLALFESGAILLYLADKTGRLVPADPARRYEAIQWLMFQVGGIGPMFGQVGFFHKFAGKDIEDKRPRDRYVGEARRLLAVLEGRLAEREWLMGDGEYTIADIAVSSPLGPQPDRLLRRGRAGRHRRLSADRPCAGGVRGAAGGPGRPADAEARHPLSCAGLLRSRPTESRRRPR